MNTPRLLPAVLAALLSLSALQLAAQEVPHREYHICGDGQTPPPLPNPRGAVELPGIVDNYGRPWRTSAKLVAWQQRRRTTAAGDCGGFRLDFEDVIAHTGVGFDDPTPLSHPVLGSTTLGALRQRTVCEVFSYIASVIEVKGAPDVIIRASQTDGGGFLAAAAPAFINGAGGFVGGTLYDHITTGVDPTPGAGAYDAMIIYDFGFAYPYNNDWAQDPGARLDLFSITLHEATHALGFLSLIGPNGTSNVIGMWSIFDRMMHTGSGTPVIHPVTRQFAVTTADLLSNTLVYSGLRCPSTQPIYSPGAWSAGSSLSHFDMNRSGVRYVMRPATGGGADRAYTPEETEVLCEMGYTLKNGRCNACAPRGVDDYANTVQGVEVCVDVLTNDIAMNPGPLSIDPASLVILAGGGSARVQGDQLCYTSDPGFTGLARILYAPATSGSVGSPATLYVNVTPRVPGPRPSRRDYDLWYFGQEAGLAFGSGTTLPVTDGQLDTYEGCATICSRTTGVLLFYTDGVSVWDADHTVMPNGTALAGDASSTQSALIVPDPGDTMRYYIFTSPELASSHRPFCYSIVDLRMNGGRGDVVLKNVELFSPSAEKLAGARHSNGRDYWIIGHELGSSRFLVYPLTCLGVGAPVASETGHLYTMIGDSLYNGRGGVGYLKFSTDGKQLVAANTFVQADANEDYLYSTVELFRFDNTTGEVSDPMVVDVQSYLFSRYYSVAFSPDNSKLYAASYSHGYIVQWDIAGRDPVRIAASRSPFSFGQSVRVGGMQLGPDRRLYVQPTNQGYIGVINKPDSLVPECDFVSEGVHLSGRLGHNGLPNMIDQDLFAPVGDTSTLRITKSVNDPRPQYGDTIAYTITVCNQSLCFAAYNVVVEDRVPSGLIPLTAYDSLLRHTIDTLVAGDCRSITLRAVVGPTVPLATDVVNCATVVSAEPESGAMALDSNCATIVVRGVDLGVAKSVDRDRADIGATVEWSVVVTSYGPDTATNVRVRESIPAGLTYLGSVVAGPAGSYDPAAGYITVPVLLPGEACVVRILCRVEADAPPVVTNCVELEGMDQSDLDITNNRACASFRATTNTADLAVVKEIDDSAPRYGAPVVWTITVTNAGPKDATDVVVNDRLPAGVRYVQHTVSDPAAAYDTASGDLTIPLLRFGDTLRLRIYCTLDSVGSGSLVNCAAVVASTPPDPQGADNGMCVTAAPRWCTQPDRTLELELADQSLSIAVAETVPVRLLTPLDSEHVRRVRLVVEVDSGQAIIANGGDPTELLRGTLFDGWSVVLHQWTRYSVVLDLEAGAQPPLVEAGDVLHPLVQLYLGGTVGATMRARLEFPDDRCIAAGLDSGYLRLDSVCGLGLRLIELGRAKYAVQSVHPNPVTGHATVGFSLGLDGPTRIDMIDATGSTRGALLNQRLDAGSYEVDLDGTALPSGLYYLRFISGDWSRTVPVIINH